MWCFFRTHISKMNNEIVAVELNDLKPGGAYELLLSDKHIKTWNFKGKDDKQVNGRKEWVEMMVKHLPTGSVGPLYLTITGVKTFKGAQVSKYDTIFICIAAQEDVMAAIRAYVDSAIYRLLYLRRYELLANAERFNSPDQVAFVLPNCVVNRGALKDPNNPLGDRYSDSMIFGMPSQKTAGGTVVDKNICVIEDPNGNPFPWDQLVAKELQEITIGVEIVLGAKLKVSCMVRSVVPNAISVPRVISRRKLDQRQREAQQQAMLAAQKAAGLLSQSLTGPPAPLASGALPNIPGADNATLLPPHVPHQPPGPAHPMFQETQGQQAEYERTESINHDLFEPIAKRAAI